MRGRPELSPQWDQLILGLGGYLHPTNKAPLSLSPNRRVSMQMAQCNTRSTVPLVHHLPLPAEPAELTTSHGCGYGHILLAATRSGHKKTRHPGHGTLPLPKLHLLPAAACGLWLAAGTVCDTNMLRLSSL
ncbi:hypothetical protein NDU88_004733 [Pleurodeles waltl]|uniref:Uncharacterized protein n=1 Tax=Pleurodeles waltl TaxID=8319 RepID=A0AAV7SJL7_PLEWA|nr:hypothetical protein NDU88_004733 [Pleurodeles waltl]